MNPSVRPWCLGVLKNSPVLGSRQGRTYETVWLGTAVVRFGANCRRVGVASVSRG